MRRDVRIAAPSLKPIETTYDGYRFRSRLEARWAVFFKTMGIAFEYEREGYDLGPAGRYLPDFWLPHFQLWAEVKPAELTAEERRKCEALVRATDRGCLLLVGPPDFREYDLLQLHSERFEEIDGEYMEVLYDPPKIEATEHALISNWFDEHRFGCMMCYGDNPDYYGEDYIAAVMAARGARFGT